MSFTNVEGYVARSRLQLATSTGYISCFLTIWKGKTLLVSFNHLTEEIFDMYCPEFFDVDDVDYIKYIIKDYLNYQEHLTNRNK